MKKLAMFLLAIVPFICSAKKPNLADQLALLKAQNATLKSELSVKDSLLSTIPDTFCITALDSTFCVPTKDAQEVAIPIVDYIKETNGNGWPRTGKGWLTWLIALVPLVFGVKKLTAINNVWNVLRPYLKTRLGLAVLSGILLSVLTTWLVSFITKSDFNTTMLAFNGVLAPLFASLIYNIKKKNAVQA